MKPIILFDWGNTVMRVFPNAKGPMYKWNKVESMPNVQPLLEKLSLFADCYLATNAEDSNKEDIIIALKKVNLDIYFKDIFCYKELGFIKPSPLYFKSILAKLNSNNKHIYMVGDNLEADILGAINSRIDGVLYDPENNYPDYKGKKISDLMELLDIIRQD